MHVQAACVRITTGLSYLYFSHPGRLSTLSDAHTVCHAMQYDIMNAYIINEQVCSRYRSDHGTAYKPIEALHGIW